MNSQHQQDGVKSEWGESWSHNTKSRLAKDSHLLHDPYSDGGAKLRQEVVEELNKREYEVFGGRHVDQHIDEMIMALDEDM